jgi:hypothetical protein
MSIYSERSHDRSLDVAFDLLRCQRHTTITADRVLLLLDSMSFETQTVTRGTEDACRTSAYARMMLTTKVRHLDLLEPAGL